MTGRGANRAPGVGPLDLLAAVLRQLPKLDDPLCADNPKLWDGENPADVAAAKAGCARCSCLLECAAFAEGRRGLSGVYAGTLKFSTSKKKKKKKRRKPTIRRPGDEPMTTPDLSGTEHRPCAKRGVLTFWHLPPEIQRREDSTMECDQRTQRRRRPATDTERLLLAHLYGTLPDDLETRVEWVSPGVRRRYWPAIPATLEGLDQL